jgi:hypothetical protein
MLSAGRCRPSCAAGHHPPFEKLPKSQPWVSPTRPPNHERTCHVQVAAGPITCVPAVFRCPTTPPPQPISPASHPGARQGLVPVSTRPWYCSGNQLRRDLNHKPGGVPQSNLPAVPTGSRPSPRPQFGERFAGPLRTGLPRPCRLPRRRFQHGSGPTLGTGVDNTAPSGSGTGR